MSLVPAEFDAGRLDDFLRAQLPSLSGTMHLERISGGQSNPTFFLTYGTRRMVLRKKPAGDILPSAHAVDREARVLTALAGSAVPVPGIVLFHAQPDVVGTPFYVMERVEGRVYPGFDLAGAAPGDRRAMVFSFAETMARMHDVDWRSIGLDGFGRPGDYFARQIARWSKQRQTAWFRDIPDLTRLETWLADHLPPDDGHATICHGDFRMGNMLFHPERPEIAAVLDWELCTIGHPMSDLAFAVIGWRSAPDEYGGLLGLDLGPLGLPNETEFLKRYFAARQTPSSALTPFHVAFAMFRFAVIFEGIAARARSGTAAGSDAHEVGELSLAFARRGVAAL